MTTQSYISWPQMVFDPPCGSFRELQNPESGMRLKTMSLNNNFPQKPWSELLICSLVSPTSWIRYIPLIYIQCDDSIYDYDLHMASSKSFDNGSYEVCGNAPRENGHQRGPSLSISRILIRLVDFVMLTAPNPTTSTFNRVDMACLLAYDYAITSMISRCI